MARAMKTQANALGRKFAPFLIWVVSVVGVFTGCGTPPVPPEDYIIRAGAVHMSPEGFARELELKKMAYPYDINTRPGEYNAMVLDLVSTLTDELVLLAAARDRGITVSDAELDAGVKQVREDYPEDSFDQMLMDNAIEYTIWKKRLKKDLILAKFLEQALMSVQEISAEDMVSFYRRMAQNGGSGKDTETGDEAALVRQLRMEKSQAAYEQWMQGLKTAAPPEINEAALAGFLIK